MKDRIGRIEVEIGSALAGVTELSCRAKQCLFVLFDQQYLLFQ